MNRQLWQSRSFVHDQISHAKKAKTFQISTYWKLFFYSQGISLQAIRLNIATYFYIAFQNVLWLLTNACYQLLWLWFYQLVNPACRLPLPKHKPGTDTSCRVPFVSRCSEQFNLWHRALHSSHLCDWVSKWFQAIEGRSGRYQVLWETCSWVCSWTACSWVSGPGTAHLILCGNSWLLNQTKLPE